MKFVGGVKVYYYPPRGSKDKLPPIFKGYLVGFVDKENVTLSPSHLLRLIHRNELHEVSPQLIGRIALVVKLDVICIFVLQYLEEVPHSGSTEGGKCLAANGHHEAAVLVA